MRLIAKVIRIPHAKFHCNRITTVQYIQDYTSLVFGMQCKSIQRRQTVLNFHSNWLIFLRVIPHCVNVNRYSFKVIRQ